MNVPGFIEEKLLGKGSYGQVFKAKRIIDGQSYAVKIIYLRELNQREIIDSVNEIRLMASLTSPYIITFYQAFYDNKRLIIVSEYSRLGDLAHLIERRKRSSRPFKENDIWRYLIQILEGLRVLHTSNVVHRDIKSANILISAPDLIKIADLGISTVLHRYPHYTQLAKTQIGTPLYIAPEIWKKRPYDSKCDMWSLGVLLYELMTFTFPFLGRNDRELTQRVCSGYYITPKGYSNDLVSVLRRLLQVNPNNRPSVNDLMNLKCIKDRVHLINRSLISGYDDNLQRESIRRMIQPSPSDGCLLSTIKITHNLRNLHFPQPMYGKRANIIKPIEQRMHIKQGVPMKKDMRQISSPELKVICDRDLWSPNKFTPLQNHRNYQLNDLQSNLNIIEERQMQRKNQDYSEINNNLEQSGKYYKLEIDENQVKSYHPENEKEKHKSDHGNEKHESNNKNEKHKSDHSSEQKESDHSNEKRKSDHSNEKRKSDHSNEKRKSNHSSGQKESDHSSEQKESDHSNEKIKSDHSSGQKESDHSNEKRKSNHSSGQKESDRSSEQKESDHSNEKRKSNHSSGQKESDRSSEQKESDHSNEKIKSHHSSGQKESDHSSEQKESDHSSEQKESDHSNEKRKSDHSKEKRKSDHSNARNKSELSQKEQAHIQKHHPQLPQGNQIEAPPRPIYRANNENVNIDNIEKDKDIEKRSNKSDSSNSSNYPSSLSYKSDYSSDPQSIKSNENPQKRLISVGNPKVKVPAGKKVRHGNPRIRKYRYHK